MPWPTWPGHMAGNMARPDGHHHHHQDHHDHHHAMAHMAGPYMGSTPWPWPLPCACSSMLALIWCTAACRDQKDGRGRVLQIKGYHQNLWGAYELAIMYINSNGHEGGRKSKAEQDALNEANKANNSAQRKATKKAKKQLDKAAKRDRKASKEVQAKVQSYWSSRRPCFHPEWGSPRSKVFDNTANDSPMHVCSNFDNASMDYAMSTDGSTFVAGQETYHGCWQDETGAWWEELDDGWWRNCDTGEFWSPTGSSHDVASQSPYALPKLTTTAVLLRGAVDG